MNTLMTLLSRVTGPEKEATKGFCVLNVSLPQRFLYYSFFEPVIEWYNIFRKSNRGSGAMQKEASRLISKSGPGPPSLPFIYTHCATQTAAKSVRSNWHICTYIELAYFIPFQNPLHE